MVTVVGDPWGTCLMSWSPAGDDSWWAEARLPAEVERQVAGNDRKTNRGCGAAVRQMWLTVFFN
jgi:hypothetical protein